MNNRTHVKARIESMSFLIWFHAWTTTTLTSAHFFLTLLLTKSHWALFIEGQGRKKKLTLLIYCTLWPITDRFRSIRFMKHMSSILTVCARYCLSVSLVSQSSVRGKGNGAWLTWQHFLLLYAWSHQEMHKDLIRIT